MKPKGISAIQIALVTVFIATFALFYIIDNLDKITKSCDTEKTSAICGELSGFNVSIIIILLFVGGFVLVISAIAYIMLTG